MNTPILIITFNRPDFLKKIISVLKKIKPKKIYFKIDGPRQGNKNDEVQILKTKKIINEIQWRCKKFIFQSKKNLGSRDNPIKGINWLFSLEKKGIILEDDCIPDKSFFKYCEELLGKYENNKNISMISGRNNLEKTDVKSSYYFTFGNTWGWATWRRAWRFNDVKLKNWNNKKLKKNFYKNLKNYPIFLQILEDRCSKIKKNKINSAWDYQWFFSTISRNMIGIIPSVNLVRNLGFDERSTHTKSNKKLYSIKSHKINFPLKHNNESLINKKLLLNEYNKIYKTGLIHDFKKFIHKIL
tara:strand:- start:22 stop:918 length:897 start_codon:yes stop_codon:yes gene_type:complete